MPAQPIQSKNPTWSRDELILALDLYAHFKGNPPGKSSSEVVRHMQWPLWPRAAPIWMEAVLLQSLSG